MCWRFLAEVFRSPEKPAAACHAVVSQGALPELTRRRWFARLAVGRRSKTPTGMGSDFQRRTSPGSSEFVESTLKRAGEEYDRRMRLQSAGMGLAEVIGAVCRYWESRREN